MAQIFISYSKKDRRRIEPILNGLEAEGLSYWIDENLMPSERTWTAMIQAELEACGCVLVLWSPHAVASQEVEAEALYGLYEGKFAQALIDDCRLNYRVERLQYADLRGWSGDRSVPEWVKLIAALRARVGSETAEQPHRRRESTPPTRRIPIPEMVEIPSGRFLMGAPVSTSWLFDEADDRERPQHAVWVPAFAMGAYPVTFDEYDAFCTATGRDKPRDEGWGRGRRPVINVSWDDATAYCQWLCEQTDGDWRLPSEAEWEYACRAGSTTRYSWGDEDPVCDETARNGANFGDCPDRRTRPVASFPANAFGLYDMHGNVWEWVEDCWHRNYDGAPTDGSAWLTSCVSSNRVLRGGSWYDTPQILRSAFRYYNSPPLRYSNYGFRVARTL